MPLDDVEREYARAVLASVNGHRGEAAAILRVDRKTLNRKQVGRTRLTIAQVRESGGGAWTNREIQPNRL
jgi:DNA-binding NtrC family response regulator